MTIGEKEVREQFEVWCEHRGLSKAPAQSNCGVTVPERYAHPKVQLAWEAWRTAALSHTEVSGPVANLLTLCRDSHPPVVNHSSSHGGVWMSEWCVVFLANGTAFCATYEVSEMDRRHMDATGAVPHSPWRVPGFGRVVAWVLVSDVVAHISRLTDAAIAAASQENK